jgi:trimeric autotransporter adhesin
VIRTLAQRLEVRRRWEPHVSFRSLPTRVLTLIVQAALVVAGGLPGVQSATSSASTQVTAQSVTRHGTHPTTAVPGRTPAVTGLVAPIPQASWIPNGQVNALATDGTYVYLAGSFTQLLNPATGGFQAHVGLARIQLSTGIADSAWSPSVDGVPRALAYSPSTSSIYVGGLFTTVNGSARTNLAAVSTDVDAALLGPNPAPDDEVRALLVDGTELVVAGSFNVINGTAQRNLAKIDLSSGALDTGFVPVVNAGVFAVNRPPGSTFYAIGGAFTKLGGADHGYLGLVSRTNGAASTWVPAALCPPTSICPALSISSNLSQLFVAAGGPGGQAIAYDLATGTRQWQITADGNTQAIAVLRNEVFVGGHFDPTFGDSLRKTLAAVDSRSGAVDPTFHPTAKMTFPGTEALLVVDGGIVAAGAQLNIGGTAQSRFAIFPATTTPTKASGRHPATRLSRSPVGPIPR